MTSGANPARCTEYDKLIPDNSILNVDSDKIFSNDGHSSFTIRPTSIHSKASALSSPSHDHER